MKSLFKNTFFEIIVDKERKYAETIFFATTVEMSEEDYKAAVLKGVELSNLFEEDSINKALSDYRNFFFIVTPEIQDWVAQQTSQMKYTQQMRIANIVSHDMIVNLAIEQTLEEAEKSNAADFAIRYFYNPEEAQKWLFEGQS